MKSPSSKSYKKTIYAFERKDITLKVSLLETWSIKTSCRSHFMQEKKISQLWNYSSSNFLYKGFITKTQRGDFIVRIQLKKKKSQLVFFRLEKKLAVL